ncbi:sulfite exporter TauE/SafE family protein [Undibacterium fentianense]|uniref:Probable membrane transporter protein n=1 Tax=Undibacterium fentianense TaxID=2828728 RepID=A0A941IDN7_9BURK|nr:sulfite exporter TauE/SafE family protein [Undibacterium fentianense]MBR7800178.1 sulfite exporter TauE/SafE family protein [Undibacterium fentianense]
MKQILLTIGLLNLSGCTVQKSELRLALLIVFASSAIGFILVWGWRLRQMRKLNIAWSIPRPIEIVIGAVTDFFDTLGIGSFAPSTAFFRLGKLVPDELIPGTLNVGHTLGTITQALIFIQIVDVAPGTLLPMIVAAGGGAWLGTSIVGGLPRFHIRLGMGAAMLLAALIMLSSLLGLLPTGLDALELTGWRWWVGVVGNFALGLLMPLGIGLYAPCMIMVSLLGMSPLAAFPIMMGSCAFLMPISSLGFINNQKYQVSTALGIALGGVPAVLIAAYLVKSLPLDYVRWIVVLVVFGVALSLIWSAWTERFKSIHSGQKE